MLASLPRRVTRTRALAFVAGLTLFLAACQTAVTTSVSTPGGGSPVALTTATAARSCAPPYPTGPVSTLTVFCADPSAMQAARVLRVVDGDTLKVEIDGRQETVRFYGTNTTERGQACFKEGTQRTTQLVGSEVRLRPDARERDRYGRLLRYVYTPDGFSIDAEMVAEGLARAWREDGVLRGPIIALEDAARLSRTGCLWSQ